MNCPFHIMVYRSSLRSYRELPLRIAELGTVYRYERSGVTPRVDEGEGVYAGTTRTSSACPSRLSKKLVASWDLTFELLDAFGFTDFSISLSTRPESYAGEPDMWEHATESLRRALEERDLTYDIDEGGGAFYGPKIDIKIEAALGREWQCTTVQFDFNLPERFDLNFMDAEGGRSRPYMVHRAILGSLERFLGVLIEHYAGAFPLWLAPTQVMVIPIADRHQEYADSVRKQMESAGYRVEVDGPQRTDEPQDSKCSAAEDSLHAGGRGPGAGGDGAVAVRTREGGNLGAIPVEELLERLAWERWESAMPRHDYLFVDESGDPGYALDPEDWDLA